MDETAVVIVGAGPSGLCLAAALATHGVKSVILELNEDICEDPRSVSINGDSQRIFQVVGITTEQLSQVGQIMRSMNFHRNDFQTPPFLSIDMTHDWLEHALPMGTVMLQPRLEQNLRDLIHQSDYAELRLGCTVTSIVELDNGGAVEATYARKDGTSGRVRGKFLVGADGKRGYVRKGYLEAKGIQQQVGIFKYQATWIAANLRIHMPTPATHPTLPLWELGYQPDDLWEMFWPRGFHFCNHELYPTATGRFGPIEDRLWRLEWELPSDEVPEDLPKALAEQLDRHITLPPSRLWRNGKTTKEPVRFPQDCVEILRCGPARFNQRVVNRWFHNNIILIGDAAHVFPPFAGQGMTNGVRDAHGLAWRLALFCHAAREGDSAFAQASMLECWARERRRGVDVASLETKRNGDLLLNKSASLATLIGYGSWLVGLATPVRDLLYRRTFRDDQGFTGAERGFFLPEHGGGRKFAQVFVRVADDAAGAIHTSDRFLCRPGAALTLLLLHPRALADAEAAGEIGAALASARVPGRLVSREIVQLVEQPPAPPPSALGETTLVLADVADVARAGRVVLPSYDAGAFRRRFAAATRFVLLRSDFIIFAEAGSVAELAAHLQRAADMLLKPY